MPPTACPRNPAKSGHWWVIDTPSGRYSSGYCKFCRVSRTDFDNVFEPTFGHDSHDPRRKEQELENKLKLSADERSKRHDFYEKKKPEIIAVYTRLKNTKATAEELTRKWGCDAPTTTIYGLLQKWGVVHKRTRRSSKPEKKGKGPQLALAAPSSPAPAGQKSTHATGIVKYLELKGEGIVMVIDVSNISRFRIGGMVEVAEVDTI